MCQTTKKVVKDLKTAVSQIGKFAHMKGMQICEAVVKKGVTMGAKTLAKSGIKGFCAQSCTMAAAEAEAAGGGPEDPVADGVAVAIDADCQVACNQYSSIWIKKSTSTFISKTGLGQVICKHVIH